MALRDKNLVPDEYYHIYNRGNNKSVIFRDDSDYDRFMKLLYLCNGETNIDFKTQIVDKKIDTYCFGKGEPLVHILAWVLMPNHFHILLVSRRSDLREGYNPISEFMRKLSTGYAMYFNKKYKRTGALFEGKFKSKHVAKEDYFNYIFAYIHLNPLKLVNKDWKDGVVGRDAMSFFLKGFPYSSFQEYQSVDRLQKVIINIESVPEYLRNAHAKELFKWMGNSPKVGPSEEAKTDDTGE